ncbi:MAG: hypothetical protein JJE05_03815 [Actinobacteria bacterium]|nr:hypothetical protein [Actinomycetota bacterium]
MDDPVINMRHPLWERLYIPLAILLIGFGILSGFSIGLPFFILGIAMVLVWPLRRRRPLFESLVVGTLAFVIVGVLAAPLSCTASTKLESSRHPLRTESTSGIGDHTTCDNLLGLTYEGTTGYNPPLWPAVVAGAAAGVLTATITYRLRRRGRSA